MASLKVLKTLQVGRGVSMDIHINESEPETSIDRYVIDVTADGGENSDVFYVPPHWHKHHSEHFTVIEGRIEVTIDGKKILVQAGEPEVLVPARAVHSFKSFKGERVRVRERADPAGEYKALFFNDLLSVNQSGGFAHVLRAFYDGDAYMALPFYYRFIDEIFITVFGGLAHLFTSPKAKTL